MSNNGGPSAEISSDDVIPCPTITVSSTPSPLLGGTTGIAYPGGTITASGGTGPYTFTQSAGTLPPGLSFDTSSGAISGTPTTMGSYNFSIYATDSNNCVSAPVQFTIDIICPDITVSSTPSPLPAGTAGIAYSGGTITASGGTGPYTFTQSAGTLPPGLIFNTSSGTISGTPTTMGSYNFSIYATDSNNCVSAPVQFTINIICPDITVSSTPSPLPAGTTGIAYSGGTITVSGGSGPYTFTLSGTLPPGLGLIHQRGLLAERRH